MKRLLSLVLVIVMLVSVLPVAVFAEEAYGDGSANTENDYAENELPDNYGSEVVIGNKVYYIEECELYCSTNNARPALLNNDVTWVIEEGGEVYYSKLDGFNTYIYKAGSKDEIVKIFCPVECFDVDEEWVYYSYNGEVTKVDVVSGEEEVVTGNNNLNGFYIKEGAVIQISENESDVNDNEFELLAGKAISDEDAKKIIEKVDNASVRNKLLKIYEKFPYGSKWGDSRYVKNIFTEKKLDVAAWQCHGFGRYVVMCLFSDETKWGNTSKNDMENIVFPNGNTENIEGSELSIDVLKQIFKGLPTGSFVRTGPARYYKTDKDGNTTLATPQHTLIYVYHDDSNIYMYEGNSDGKNHVYMRKYTWNDLYNYVKEAGRYTKNGLAYILKPKAAVYHTCSTELSTKYYETYINNQGDKVLGACKECHVPYNWKSKVERTGSYIYELKPLYFYKKTYIRTAPYKDADLISNKIISRYKVIGELINAYGNKWYVIDYEDNSKNVCYEAYVYSDGIDSYYKLNEFESTVYNKNEELGSGNYIDAESTIVINSTKHPTGDLVKGKSYGLRGTITSNYDIKTIVGEIVNAETDAVVSATSTIKPNTRKYEITSKAKLNQELKFGSLNVGTYYLRYTVEDCSGTAPKVWTTKSEPFRIIDNTPSASVTPSISVTSIEAGQRATVTCSDGGALIHVTGYGEEKTGYGSITLDFTSPGSNNISAWTTANGKTESSTVTKSVYVSQMESPYISDATYTDSNVMVTLSGNGEIHYTTDGSDPTKWSNKYTGPIYIDRNCTVKAIAVSYGCINSNVSEKYITVKVPDAPVIKLDTNAQVAQGKTVSVSWNAVERASGYKAYLLKDGEIVTTIETTGLSATFALNEKSDTENIEYDINVVATNFVGDSGYSNTVAVTAMHPVTVTVKDKIVRENGITDSTVEQIQQNVNNHDGEEAQLVEGNVISVQKLEWGTKPSKPATPSKKGFTFAGYSEGLYYPATEDVTVDALYEINYYTVEFWNSIGEDKTTNYQLGDTQEIMYACSATPPTGFTYPTGYTLAGWNVDNTVSECYDYGYVDGNMKLFTSYTWENTDLPTVVTITGVSRNENYTSYAVKLNYVNNNFSDTQARLIVSLYTADGRMVYTQTKDVDMDAFAIGKSLDDTVQLNYTNKISKVSAVMVQVKNDMTGGAVSEMAYSEDIEFPATSGYWASWSDWSTTAVTASDTRQVETKTQSRYTDRQYTTSSSKTLDGWEWYNTTSAEGDWSGWSQTYVSAFENDAQKREVETYWEPATYKTQYHYYAYYKGSSAPWTWSNSSHPYLAEIWIDYELPYNRTSGGMNQYGGSGYDFGYPFNRWLKADGSTYGLPSSDQPYFTRQVQTGGGYTMYRYKDTWYTHYFRKWNSWSNWSDTVYTASGDRMVETRTMYRYRDYYPVYDPALDDSVEEETIKKYEIAGSITGFSGDFAGKLATVMVYKKTNTDPTQEQLQYVEQITIGEGNSYSFTVNPKEEIDYLNTGDYIVTLSIEGCERLVNVDVIKAPVPTYEVVFYSEDGVQFGDVQYVELGGAVDVNEIGIPEKEGHRFVKWNKSVVDIKKNTSVTAVFEKEIYAVVFVDHENETAEIQEYAYGDPITAPTVTAVEGKAFLGWDLFEDNDEMLATDTVVVTAQWETLTYTVKFCDFEGNVISEQAVEYGNAAEVPEMIEIDGMLYSWDLMHGEWWNVTSDMTVYPYIPQVADVAAPTINVSTEETGGMFYAELESSQENGVIYYSLYNEITHEDAKSYAETVITDKEMGEEEVILMGEEATEAVEDATDVDDEIINDENDYLTSIEEYVSEYTEPIQITEGTVVYAFVMDEEGNISPISVFEYGYSDYEDEGVVENTYEIDPECPVITIPSVSVKPGETVSVPITIKNNPGITSLSLVLGYDMNNLLLMGVENGSVFGEGDEFTEDIRGDGSCKFTWSAEDVVTNDGTLLTLTFMTNEAEGTYKLTSYIDAVTAPEEDENPFATVDGKITNEDKEIILGDVNEDDVVDFVDGILVMRYDSGLADIAEDKLDIADVNRDGWVDFIDGILILRYDVGLISSFDE